MICRRRKFFQGKWAATQIFWVVSLICIDAGAQVHQQVEVKENSEVKAEIDPADSLRELVELWGRYEMPFPPEKAPLIEIPTEYWSGDNDRRSRSIGFRLKDAKHSESGDAGVIALVGAMEYEVDANIKLIDAVQELSQDDAIKAASNLRGDIGILSANHLYVTALQCLERGWEDTALALFKRASETEGGHPHSPLSVGPETPAKDAVIRYLWAFAQKLALHPSDDRSDAAKLMRDLLDDGHGLPNEAGVWLCESLEAALVPSNSEPGTVEALIDKLVDTTKNGGAFGGMGKLNENDPYSILQALGFEAIPFLIDHIDDKRLTRSVTQGFNNFPTWPRQVGDVVSDLLQGIAGDELGSDWLQRQKGGHVDRTAVLNWWKKVEAQGERSFLLERVYPGKKDGFPNSAQLAILSKKYPEALPEVYRRMLDEFPEAESHPVAKAIEDSKLADDFKITHFSDALEHSNWSTRYPALNALEELDDELFVQTLKKWLKDWPADATGPYWKSREARISHAVLSTEDEEVWRLFEVVLAKACVGLRMELLNTFNYTNKNDVSKSLRVKTLMIYLDDETRRIASGAKYDGPYAGFHHPSLRVCDFISGKVAGVLQLNSDDWPEKVWKRADRTRLRGIIRSKLEL